MSERTHMIAVGLTAFLAMPIMLGALHLPLLVAVPIGFVFVGGVSLVTKPRARLPRVDFGKIGRAQAEVVDALIAEADTQVAALDAAVLATHATDLRAAVARLATAARTILGRLADAPEKLPAARRFLATYLPRSVEIAGSLGAVERQSRQDPARRAAIVATLARLEQAFTATADGLDQGDLEALDVELKLVDRALAEDRGPVDAAPSAKGA